MLICKRALCIIFTGNRPNSIKASGGLKMSGKYSVTVSKVARDNSLETIYMPDIPDSEIVIRSQDVNRPGLLFAGYDG